MMFWFHQENKWHALYFWKVKSQGLKSRSWLAWQIPVYTEGFHKNSRIIKINKSKILKYLKREGLQLLQVFRNK